jgi:hypothetical protein
MLTGHGDDAYRYEREIIADFSTNVWHGGAPAGLKAYLFENIDLSAGFIRKPHSENRKSLRTPRQ